MYKRGVQCRISSAWIGFQELEPTFNETFHILALQLCERAHFVDCIQMNGCDIVFMLHSQEYDSYHVVGEIKNFNVSQGIQTLHNFYCVLRMHNSTQLLEFVLLSLYLLI